MDEHKLQDIWEKNLREFNDVMRLDSIIIRAMQEAIKEAQNEQLILSGVIVSFSEDDMKESFNAGLNRGFDEGQDQSHSNHTEPEFKEWLEGYVNEL